MPDIVSRLEIAGVHNGGDQPVRGVDRDVKWKRAENLVASRGSATVFALAIHLSLEVEAYRRVLHIPIVFHLPHGTPGSLLRI